MCNSAISRRALARMTAAGVLASRMRLGAATRKNLAVSKAMASMLKAEQLAASDPWRPVYHFHPPANWMNDPNGTIFYKGWHHLFYQCNPYGAEWGHMHWGHARSHDLVNWEQLPIALWPSIEKGEEHVFSGSAVIGQDGRPRIFYTSIGKRDPEQWMAVPADDDLIVWEKFPANPVMTLQIHGGRRFADWRDPFVIQEGGKTYMICGGNWNGRSKGGSGVVQLYEATNADLTGWKHRGPLFEYRDTEIANIECPNLVRVDKKWVLLISPHRPCEYFVGDLDLVRGQFLLDTHGIVDAGASYASNISVDDKGRTILWLWGQTATDPAKGWNGCMVLPRILSIDGAGFLRQQPAKEIESLRGEPQPIASTDLAESPVALGAGDCIEMQLTLHAGTSKTAGLRIGPNTEVVFESGSGLLIAGKARKLIGLEQPVRLRVFIDKCVLEVYANDGEAAIFTTFAPYAGDPSITGFARGGKARIEAGTIWAMKPAQFNMDLFKE